MNYEEQKEAQEQGEAQSIINDYLHMIRNQFYPDDQRRFFAHRYMLVQAIAWPARVLGEMEVWLEPQRIRQILNEIIQGIKHHGDTEGVKHFGAYFLSSVQKHVQKRKDHLYDEGKTARATAVGKMPLNQILAGAKVVEEAETAAQTSERLVQIADMFRPKRRQKAAPKPPEPPKKSDDQLSLF
jgi:hypothetical protein